MSRKKRKEMEQLPEVRRSAPVEVQVQMCLKKGAEEVLLLAARRRNRGRRKIITRTIIAR